MCETDVHRCSRPCHTWTAVPGPLHLYPSPPLLHPPINAPLPSTPLDIVVLNAVLQELPCPPQTVPGRHSTQRSATLLHLPTIPQHLPAAVLLARTPLTSVVLSAVLHELPLPLLRVDLHTPQGQVRALHQHRLASTYILQGGRAQKVMMTERMHMGGWFTGASTTTYNTYLRTLLQQPERLSRRAQHDLSALLQKLPPTSLPLSPMRNLRLQVAGQSAERVCKKLAPCALLHMLLYIAHTPTPCTSLPLGSADMT